MLVDILESHGNAYHIHTRNPPTVLKKPNTQQDISLSGIYSYGEQFGNVDNDNPNTKVIFIYSTPEHSINSK